MEFCLLAPLAVRRGDTVVPVQAGKQRAVLATLLLHANRVVPVEELAETLRMPNARPLRRSSDRHRQRGNPHQPADPGRYRGLCERRWEPPRRRPG